MKEVSIRKCFFKISITFLVAALCILGLLKINNSMERARVIIAQRLEKVVDREISIGEVRVNLFGYVMLDDVKVAGHKKLEEGKLLDCGRIVVRFNLFKYLFKKRPIEEIISKIVFHSPVLSLSSEGEMADYGIAPVIPITCNVVIKNGTADVEYGSIFSLKAINGSFKLDEDKNKVEFTISAKTGGSAEGRIKVDGVLRAEEFAVRLNGKDIGLKDYFKLLSPESRFVISRGTGDIQLILSRQSKRKKLFLSGELLVRDGSLSFKEAPYAAGIINGRIQFDNDMISCENLGLKYGESESMVSGAVMDFLSPSPKLELSAESLVELADLPGIVKQDWMDGIMPLNGKAKIEMKVAGTLDNPVLNGSLILDESTVAGVRIDNFETKFKYSDRVIDMQGFKVSLYEGVFNGKGSADFSKIKNPKLDLDFNLDGMNLALIPVLREPHEGYLNFRARLSGGLDNLQCEGDMSVRKMKIGDYALGSVSGPFRYRGGRLRFNVRELDNSYDLAVNCLWKKEEKTIDLTEFKMTLNNGGVLEFSGNVFMDGKDELNVQASIENIMANQAPFIRRYYPDINGLFDFNGWIKGTIQSPDISGLFTTKDMTVNSLDINIEADFRYFEKALSMKAFNVNDSYFGNILLDFAGGKPRVSGKMKCINAEMEVALNLLPVEMKKDVNGVVNGNVEFSGPFVSESLEASGELSIENVSFGRSGIFQKVGFGFNIADEKLMIKEFACINEQGKIEGSAEVGLKKDTANKFRIKTRWDNYSISSSTPMPYNAVVSGECAYSGKLYVTEKWKTDISGYLSTKNLTVNEEPLEEINTKVSYKNKILSIRSFTFGEIVRGNAKLSFNKPVSIDSRFRIKSKDIPDFINSFLRRKFVCEGGIMGELTGDVLFYGTVESPVMEGAFRIKDGEFRGRNIGFGWESKFKYAGKILDFENARLKFDKPYGEIIVAGKIDFNSDSPFELDGRLKSVPVEVMEDILINYLDFAGEVDGNIYLRGDYNKPVLRADLVSKNNTIFGYKLKNLKTKVRIQESVLYVDSLSAEYAQSIIRLGRKSVFTSKGGKKYGFSFPVHLRNVGMKNLSLFGELKLEGVADFSGEQSRINTEITINDLWINQWNIAGMKTRLDYKNDIIRYIYPGKETKFGAKVNLSDPDIIRVENIEIYDGKKKILDVKCDVNMRNGHIIGSMKTLNHGIETRTLGKLLNLRDEQKGQTTFNVNLAGNWLGLLSGSKEYLEEKPSVEGTVEINGGNLRYLDFDKLRASFKGDEKEIELEYLQVMKTDKYVIDASGKLPYETAGETPEKDHRIRVKMFGDNSMQLLSFLGPIIEDCSGAIDGEATITGSVSKPVINGYFKGSGGVIKKKIKKPYFGGRITDVLVDIGIKNNNLKINKFRGRMEDARLDISGDLSFTGDSVRDFDLYMEMEGGAGISIESHYLAIPIGLLGGERGGSPSKGKIKGEIHAYGSMGAYQIDGEIELNESHFTFPAMPKNRDKGRMEFLMPATWDLKLTTGENVTYTKQYITARIKGGIGIAGNTNELIVNGEAQTIDGDIYYLNSNYKLKEGNIEIIDNNVMMSGRAETRIPGDTIIMSIERSSFPDLKIRLSSLTDSEMSSEDALLKVAGMYYKDMSERERNAMLSQELVKTLDMTLAPLLEDAIRAVSRELKLPKFLQPDRIKVELPMIERFREWNLPYRISVGKYLDKEGLYFGYVINSDIAEGGEIEVSHDVDFLSRLFNLPSGGEFIKVRQKLPLGRDTIITLEKQVRF